MTDRRSNIKSDKYLEQAIVQLLSLKLRTGASIETLERFTERCVDQVRHTTRNVIENRSLDIHRLGSVLRAWHKETEYLTFDGLPRPLKAEGRSSLKTLIRRFYPAERFEVVFARLVEARLIRTTGTDLWMPSGRTARISQRTHETLEHLAQGVARYVETVTTNVSAQHERDVLFERSCKVTKLPAAHFDSFREFVNQQAISFLTTVDDWLESRNAKSKRPASNTCTAGVHAFAYVAGKGDPRRSRSRRRN